MNQCIKNLENNRSQAVKQMCTLHRRSRWLCSAALHSLISLFIQHHLPHPSWMNMHSSRLQIRVRYSSHLLTRILNCRYTAVGNRDTILIISEGALSLDTKKKPRQQRLHQKFSYCPVSRHKHPHSHAHTQAWKCVKIAQQHLLA